MKTLKYKNVSRVLLLLVCISSSQATVQYTAVPPRTSVVMADNLPSSRCAIYCSTRRKHPPEPRTTMHRAPVARLLHSNNHNQYCHNLRYHIHLLHCIRHQKHLHKTDSSDGSGVHRTGSVLVRAGCVLQESSSIIAPV